MSDFGCGGLQDDGILGMLVLVIYSTYGFDREGKKSFT